MSKALVTRDDSPAGGSGTGPEQGDSPFLQEANSSCLLFAIFDVATVSTESSQNLS